MDRILVDTNVASYVMKNHPLAAVYRKHIHARILCLSFVSVGEFYLGAERAGWGVERRRALERALGWYVVIPYDDDLARNYARVVMGVRRIKRQIDYPDAWIAATALSHGLPLVTHNPRHFEAIAGLCVITEADGSPN